MCNNVLTTQEASARASQNGGKSIHLLLWPCMTLLSYISSSPVVRLWGEWQTVVP